MFGGFKRSGLFGLIGVFVVAAVVATIGLTMGQGESNPKLALGLIFGVIAIFCLIFFVLQRADLERAAGSDAVTTGRAAASGHPVENPTTIGEAELWAALAIAPIDAEAIRARDEVWDVGRRSIRLGMLVTLLIFLTVPPIYLTESLVPLLIGGPLIALAALYGTFRAIGPAGEIDMAFERTNRAMRPLGLEVIERPEGSFEVRGPAMPGFDYRLRGWTVLGGQRHERRVAVRIGGHEDAGSSEVLISGAANEYEAKSKRLIVRSGSEGIAVVRKQGEPRDWLCDLWLAEQLAGGAQPTRPV